MYRMATIICLSLIALPSLTWAYSGGTGEPNDPYQIATAEDLIALGQEPNDYNDCFILTADIDLSSYRFDRALIASDVNDHKDSYQGTAFNGFFHGQGHRIINLCIEGDDYLGLFGQLGSQAFVLCLGLDAVDINGVGNNIGSLAGLNWNSSIISCYSTGMISGNRIVGGLIGNNFGSITACYSTAMVYGIDRGIGGLVGLNSGRIESCYSSGFVGGGAVEEGAVWIARTTGGLVGEYRFTNSGVVRSSFWDIESSGQDWSTGGEGNTTAQMQTLSTYVNAGWDLTGETACGISDYWLMQEGSYPRLAVFSTIPTEPNGTGTPGDPYRLTDVNELGSLWFRPLNHYQLEQDLDLVGINWHLAVSPWFNGCLDGNEHVIHHLQIEGGSNLGLFGTCSDKAYISNLGLETVDVNAMGSYVGGVAGKNYGTLKSSYCTGSIRGRENNGVKNPTTSSEEDCAFGGLVGYNGGTISGSYSAGTVRGISYVGGLIGLNEGGHASANISNSSIYGSEYVGGLVGGNKGIISSCYSTGAVNGNGQPIMASDREDIGEITEPNAISFQWVSTGKYMGGHVGYNWNTIKRSYCTGSIGYGLSLGGFVGTNDGTVRDSFWDIESSDFQYSDGAIGLTTEEMMNMEMLGLNGLAEDPNWIIDAGQDYPRLTWEETPGQAIAIPVIDWLHGQGSIDDPYRIETRDQLIRLSKAGALMNKCFALVNDLDMTGLTWSQAVIPNFQGTFDGQQHIIYNLTMEGYNHLGLFGHCDQGSKIKSLKLEALNITGTDHVGGLAGYNQGGTITSCYSLGLISSSGNSVGGLIGTNSGMVSSCHSDVNIINDIYRINAFSAGGLIGNNQGVISSSSSVGPIHGFVNIGGLVGFNSGTITSSFSAGIVSGRDGIGGLVGSNHGPITSSFSTSSVSGLLSVGGLVGYNEELISGCYSTGAVRQSWHTGGGLVGSTFNDWNSQPLLVTQSFWDTETSGLTRSNGGTGLTTSPMQDINTYLNAGWDFIDEADNGTDDLWWIDNGQDYPHLWWEAVN